MGIWENMNKRVKKLSILDVKLAQGAAMFAALIVAKLIPQIMDISIWWFVVLLVVCIIKPFYVFYIKNVFLQKGGPVFCPKCRAEYRKGFTECADCKVPLVSELSPEPKTEYVYVDFEEVLATFNMGDIVIIKSILDSEKVPYFFKDEYSLQIRPVEPAKLMVRKDQVKKVKGILKEIKLNYMATTGGL
ncbi:MAG: hypothetical protein HY769_00685 [Candidatus Stahlbacteria bacterium]|nr:hypothetical protein [Candidatus Stahlbacteria bacterium]